jgi:hypothetical protein
MTVCICLVKKILYFCIRSNNCYSITTIDGLIDLTKKLGRLSQYRFGTQCVPNWNACHIKFSNNKKVDENRNFIITSNHIQLKKNVISIQIDHEKLYNLTKPYTLCREFIYG